MIKFSPVIIGTMRLGSWGVNMSTAELEWFIDECLDLGLKDFDHADIYGHYTTESQFGEVIKRRPELKHRVCITTKCGIKVVSDERPKNRLTSYDSGSAHILQSVDQSLTNLGIERIELLLLHRPDFLMDPYDISDAFEELSDAGKVKHFGVSNFTTAQFDLLNDQFPLVTNQVEMSVLHPRPLYDGTLDQCMRKGISPTAWSPFGGGEIFRRTDDERVRRIQKTVHRLCGEYSAEPDQIMLSWLFSHPAGIVPVIGTSKIKRIKAARAAREIELSKEDWYALLEASNGEPVP